MGGDKVSLWLQHFKNSVEREREREGAHLTGRAGSSASLPASGLKAGQAAELTPRYLVTSGELEPGPT